MGIFDKKSRNLQQQAQQGTTDNSTPLGTDSMNIEECTDPKICKKPVMLSKGFKKASADLEAEILKRGYGDVLMDGFTIVLKLINVLGPVGVQWLVCLKINV